MDVDSDAVLWARSQGGLASAFGELFRRHSSAVYNHAFRRTASWERAEDVVSIVFLEAWRARGKVVLDADGSLLPWLLGIANNVLRHEYRARLRHARLLARLPMPESVPDHAGEVEQRLVDQERMTALLHQMSGLTVGEQEVIALCVWAELTYEQAAVAMNVPVGTVRSRLSRARAKLRARVAAPTRPISMAKDET